MPLTRLLGELIFPYQPLVVWKHCILAGNHRLYQHCRPGIAGRQLANYRNIMAVVVHSVKHNRVPNGESDLQDFLNLFLGGLPTGYVQKRRHEGTESLRNLSIGG